VPSHSISPWTAGYICIGVSTVYDTHQTVLIPRINMDNDE